MGINLLFTAVTLFSSAFLTIDASKFGDLFEASWALDHIVYDGDLLHLKLDNFSGAGFASKSKYLYGKTSAEIKLVPGDSAGTVTAFYTSSDGPNHNEFDFEFLGNTSGEPYLVQTNLYIDGIGNREQRMDLWFDPTVDFHTYSIEWSQKHVIFAIDSTPIRVYEDKGKLNVPFPKSQRMGVYSSLWNADDWATQGGRVKTDWSHAPFVTSYRGFEIEEWREEGQVEEMSVHQRHQVMWVRAKHLVYDYCGDVARFGTRPIECGV